jgi:hypothetical protein
MVMVERQRATSNGGSLFGVGVGKIVFSLALNENNAINSRQQQDDENTR